MSESFMSSVLGAKSRIEVSIAWGADLTALAATWTWTDITNKVYVNDGVSLSVGRSDEASTTQPATCSFTADNSDAGFSLGGQSPNYPNVRRNTPIRVRVSPDGGAFQQMFLGYADQFNPEFDPSGKVAKVKVSASGMLRRLAQNTKPLISPIRRGIMGLPELVDYWPCEDGDLSTNVASALPTGAPMNLVAAFPDFAASTDFVCSLPLLKLNNAWLGGEVAPHTSTNDYQVRFLISIPSSGSVDNGPLCSVFFTGGTIYVWDIIYKTTGDLRIVARRNTDPVAGPFVLDTTIGFDLDGKKGQLGLQVTQNGANIDWEVDFLNVDFSAGGTSGTVAGQTFGRIQGVLMNGLGQHDEITVGHVSVERVKTAEITLRSPLTAFIGDLVWFDATSRLNRLCLDNGIPLTIESTSNGGITSDFTDNMGEQDIDSLLPLLREAEKSDQGYLHDGTTQGLRYLARRRIENQDPLFTIDAGDLVAPSGPVADDQGTQNRVQVTQKRGTTAEAEDITGPMGTNTIGAYEASHTISTYFSQSALQYANWLLFQGTIEGYRYPQLSLDIAGVRNPKALALQLLTLLPGLRIDVVGFSRLFPQHPDVTLQLLVQGYTHTFTATQWRTTINVSPYEPWRVVQIAAATADTDEFLLHLDTTGSTLTSSVAKSATSMSLTTPSGPLWTTVADDFPFDLEVGGIKVVCTNITGAASPQTATVAAVTKALSAGSAVKVWKPTVLAL